MGTKWKRQRQFGLLPPAGLPKFIAIYMLGPLPQLKSGNLFVVIINDRYSKLTCKVSKTYITSTNVTYIHFIHWVVSYKISDIILSDSG